MLDMINGTAALSQGALKALLEDLLETEPETVRFETAGNSLIATAAGRDGSRTRTARLQEPAPEGAAPCDADAQLVARVASELHDTEETAEIAQTDAGFYIRITIGECLLPRTRGASPAPRTAPPARARISPAALAERLGDAETAVFVCAAGEIHLLDSNSRAGEPAGALKTGGAETASFSAGKIRGALRSLGADEAELELDIPMRMLVLRSGEKKDVIAGH